MKYSIKYKKLKVMNQIYRKEDPMKRIVLLLTAASLLIWPANTFAEPFEGPHPDKHDFVRMERHLLTRGIGCQIRMQGSKEC